MRRLLPLSLVATLGIVGLAACGSSTPKIAVGLNAGGCDSPVIAIPTGSVTLEVTNKGGGGEIEILNGDTVLAKKNVDENQTVPLSVNLKTGTYSVECRTDDTTATLIAGSPSGAAGEPGAPAAFPAATKGFAVADGNSYASTNLVANSAKYDPAIVDPNLINAWGIANRPAGAGGHIWVSAEGGGSTEEFVGDVGTTPLYQDTLRSVSVPGVPLTDGAPAGATDRGHPTGQVFNGSETNFMITQGTISGPAKFIFVGSDGVISAWTERKNADGSTDRQPYANVVADRSAQGSAFFSVAVAPSGDDLLVADFGPDQTIRTYDSSFQEIPTVGFVNPFVKAGAAFTPGDLVPWNVTTSGGRVFVSYAALGADEKDPKKPAVAEEAHAPGAGRVVEFDGNGNLVKILADKKMLNAPWGVTIAPPDFGKLSGDVLVANFGDGTIAAFDPTTDAFVDYLRGADGKPVVNDGIWGLLPGNGASLGKANAVYFSAGPRGEQDGVFGRLDANQK